MAGEAGTGATAVVGGGVVGAAVAFALAEAGREVVLFAPSPPGTAGTTIGNAGQFASGEIFALASPASLRNGIAALAGRGPVILGPHAFPKMVPWFARFALAACSPRAVARAADAVAAMQREAPAATRSMLARAGLADEWVEMPTLYPLRDAREIKRAEATVAAAAARGFAWEVVRGEALAALEPSLSEAGFAGALVACGSARCRHPRRIVEGLWRAAEAAGARFRQARVVGFASEAQGVRVCIEGEDAEATRCFASAVLAAGADSAPIARSLGEHFPLTEERGYGLTLPHPNIELRHGIITDGEGVAFTPLEDGIRLTGFSELGGGVPSLAKRAHRLRTRARMIFPRLEFTGTDDASLWHGARPTLPDFLPAIGASTRDPRVRYAFGHNHLGLTLAALTADATAHALGVAPRANVKPPTLPAACDPARFFRAR